MFHNFSLINDHDSLNISTHEKFIQKTKIFFRMVKIVTDIEEFFFTKIDNS